ncbi:MAG: endolytic transglycosylase MltG [Butyricicoccus pullicaecorum]|nr:endolytic transglycosylase MltG [Butyricicoccus pullicaecorum]
MENRRYTPKHSDKTGPVKRTPEPARRTNSTSATSRPTTPRRTGSTPPAAGTTRRPSAARPSTTPPSRGSRTDSSRASESVKKSAPVKREASTQREQSERKGSGGKKPPQKSGCALASLYFICILGISVCLALVLIFSANDVLALVKPDTEIEVVVTKDTTVKEVSKQLDESGVVNYGILFKIFNVVKGDGETIVSAGTYTLNPTMDYGQILRAMTKTTSTTSVKVTIPEGYTTSQIRQTLLEKHVTSPALLDNALNTYPFKHKFLQDLKPPKANWLEGYLFPDTYEFIQDSKQPVHEVINVMLNNFDKKYDKQIQAGAEELGLSTHEVVIIASLIEREAKESDEFAKISGVIHNRLNNKEQFPHLQIDAALQYAVGHNNRLTDADKQLDSPYNLYLHEGLPPGPICNPGYNALYAATHPEEHDYYYYVAMPDGTHLFAKSNSQHNKNRAKAEKAWEEQSE